MLQLTAGTDRFDGIEQGIVGIVVRVKEMIEIAVDGLLLITRQ